MSAKTRWVAQALLAALGVFTAARFLPFFQVLYVEDLLQNVALLAAVCGLTCVLFYAVRIVNGLVRVYRPLQEDRYRIRQVSQQSVPLPADDLFKRLKQEAEQMQEYTPVHFDAEKRNIRLLRQTYTDHWGEVVDLRIEPGSTEESEVRILCVPVRPDAENDAGFTRKHLLRFENLIARLRKS